MSGFEELFWLEIGKKDSPHERLDFACMAQHSGQHGMEATSCTTIPSNRQSAGPMVGMEGRADPSTTLCYHVKADINSFCPLVNRVLRQDGGLTYAVRPFFKKLKKKRPKKQQNKQNKTKRIKLNTEQGVRQCGDLCPASRRHLRACSILHYATFLLCSSLNCNNLHATVPGSLPMPPGPMRRQALLT